MTHRYIMSSATTLVLAIALFGFHTVQASEVTGTLSSDTANTAVSGSGSIGGTVTSNSSSRSSSGGSRGGGSLISTPSGSVLGAASSNPATPSFPNAGVSPERLSLGAILWSHVTTLITHILPSEH